MPEVYDPILSTETDPDQPLKSSLAKRWSTNWIAGFEGAAGAPRINSIGAMDHQGAAGAVGTYAFCNRVTAADASFGATVAGSDLRPVGAAWFLSFGGSAPTVQSITGSTLSGTWRCMGYYDSTFANPTNGSTALGATLWLRIA